MGKLTSKIIRAVRTSNLTEEEVIAAIEKADKPEPVRKRRYLRRDMQAQA